MSWDDGKHQKVKKVQLTYDDIIYSIQVSYEGTLQSQLRGSIGPKSAEFTLASDEYITALSAYGKTLVSQEVITALTFTTNKRTYGPYGNKSGYQISAPEGTGKQIAGFLGTSSNILNSIDVHYAPVPTAGTGGSGTGSGGSETGGSSVQKLDAKGGTGGTVWDDGWDHDGVTRITLDTDENGIEYIQFDYVKGGQAKLGVFHGGGKAFPRWIVIKHPEEYLISVEGCYSSSSNMIQGIQFKTNKNTSEYYGDSISSDDPEFTLQIKDKKIIGFHGSASNNLNSIGAYFVPSSTTTTPTGGAGTGGTGTGGTGTGDTGTGATGTGGTGTGGTGTGGSDAQRLDAQGGTGGAAWDDGSDHDGLTKVTVGSGGGGIEYVQFDYVKGGQAKLGVNHGGSKAIPNYVVIKHPEEYLVSVEGWYDSSNVILGIQFKTNKNTSQYFGYDFSDDGTKFTLQIQDKKIIGFHGSASNNLNSIGAYFVLSTTSTTPTNPPKKLKAEGGETGAVWDDGAHDNVTKVYVGQGDDGIAAVKFVYANGSQVVFGNEHGKKTLLGFEGFELASDEYITSVEGTYDKIFGNDGATVTRLIFKTNKNRTEGPYGLEGRTPFTLKDEGYKIVGFHGLAGHESINAIGAYLAPVGTIPLIPAQPSGQKLEGIGGEGGTSWDDGVFDGVRKVSVGQGEDGIGAVKFVYDKGAQAVIGDVHGKRTLLGFEDLVLDYPNEYITAVEGTYDQISASDSEIITMLRFKTNKQTSIPFGLEAGKPFSFRKEGHKIIGFHGKAGDLLHKFGVHVVPIN